MDIIIAPVTRLKPGENERKGTDFMPLRRRVVTVCAEVEFTAENRLSSIIPEGVGRRAAVS